MPIINPACPVPAPFDKKYMAVSYNLTNYHQPDRRAPFYRMYDGVIGYSGANWASYCYHKSKDMCSSNNFIFSFIPTIKSKILRYTSHPDNFGVLLFYDSSGRQVYSHRRTKLLQWDLIDYWFQPGVQYTVRASYICEDEWIFITTRHYFLVKDGNQIKTYKDGKWMLV